jgi:hypothetical protein
VVIDVLLKNGATPDEIEKIVLNEKMNGVFSGSQEIYNLYGKGSISVIIGNPSKEEADAQILSQEQNHSRRYLEASLGLFADGAIALDEFATENPRIAQLSMLAMEVALSGPSRFALNYCSRELGLQGKLDACKNKIHAWLSKKVSDISELSPDTSELLVSGGVFGVGFGFSFAGLQAKEKILHNAKKVGEVARRVEREIGDASKYGKLTRPGGFHDGLEAHHMPSERYLKANAMDPKEGFSAMMTKPLHAQTRTYKGKAVKLDTSAPYREEIGKDLADYMRILKEDGSWTPEVRRSLQQGLDNFKKEFPELFKKLIK